MLHFDTTHPSESISPISSAQLWLQVDARNCDEPCPNYGNLLCGGLPDYFGVFMDYDKLALSGQGAYDPWRSRPGLAFQIWSSSNSKFRKFDLKISNISLQKSPASFRKSAKFRQMFIKIEHEKRKFCWKKEFLNKIRRI